MKKLFFAAITLTAAAGCGRAPEQLPVDEAAVQRLLARHAAAGAGGEAGEKAKKLDAVAGSLVKAPVERADGMLAAALEPRI